jgi:hypothetical protein
MFLYQVIQGMHVVARLLAVVIGIDPDKVVEETLRLGGIPGFSPIKCQTDGGRLTHIAY